MRVLYLGNDRPFCTEGYVKRALEQLGVEVTLKRVKFLTFRDVMQNVQKHPWDFVLFSKPHRPYFDRLLQECRQMKLRTVCWQWDLYWGYRPSRPPQFYADHLFTTDGGHQDLWQQYYPHHRVLRQGISTPLLSCRARRPQYDVCFVGSVHRQMYPGRLALIDHLKKKYSERLLIVTDRRGEDLSRTLTKVQIVIGDSYPSPHYWSNRIYVMLGRGAFLLYPRTEGLSEHYQDGVHYVGFEHGNFQELDDLIAFYLAHPREMELIRRAGFEHTRDHHTYEHRAADLLRMIGPVPSST